MVSQNNQEILTGYVMDVACIRRYSLKELYEKAPSHTKECSLTGHCMESGYGIIEPINHQVAVLDAEATPLILNALKSDSREKGNMVQVIRKKEGKGMQTVNVEILKSDNRNFNF